MTEISFITQNGEQINLKDAAGREMLATKQNKLKAGNGISIAPDGTISATGAGGAEKIIAIYNDEDGYGTQAKIINPQGFKTGKKYKATLYMQQLAQETDVVEIAVQIRQGALANEEEEREYGYHMGVSGWSPYNLNITNDGNHRLYDGNYELLYITINKEQLSRTFNTETPIVLLDEFEYKYSEYKEGIRGIYWNDSTNEYEGEEPDSYYIADYPEVLISVRRPEGSNNGYIWHANGTNNTCGCLRVEFEEVK